MIASTGCRPSDPLVGTWSNDTCFGTATTPPDIEKCSVALTFNDGLEISLVAEWFTLPATAERPGCIITKEVTGQSWSTTARADFDVLHVDGTGEATVERHGCVYPEDDLDQTATSDLEIPSGDINYQISSGTLTVLTSDLAGTYAP
jgi:hypothetical protein